MKLVGKKRRGLDFLDNRKKKEKKQTLCKSAMYQPVILCSYRTRLKPALNFAHCEPGTAALLLFS